MWLEFFDFWGRETLDNIRRNRLMSLVAITTVTVGLFILGAFHLTNYNIQKLSREQTEKLDLVMLLKKDVSTKRSQELTTMVANMPQVGSVKFLTADQVYAEARTGWLKRLNMGDMNKRRPFLPELRIKLKDPEDLFKVRAYLSKLRGIAGYRSDEDADKAARNLLTFNRYVAIAGLVAFIVLGLAILLIIHNAIRLTVFARRREIRIMQLVGATPDFIRVPFLLEGVVYGFVGAILATLALGVLCLVANSSSFGLVQSMTPPGTVFGNCSLLLMAAGVFFGILGAFLSFNHSQKTTGV